MVSDNRLKGCEITQSPVESADDQAQFEDKRIQKRCIIVTNIPTPYRGHLFRYLHREFERRGVRFEVYFMAKSELGRKWRYDARDNSFPHRIFRGIHLSLGGAVFHFNPTLVKLVLLHPPDWLILGGSWAAITTYLLSFVRWPIPSSTKLLLWSEANDKAFRRRSRFVRFARSLPFKNADGYVVPGLIAIGSICRLVRTAGKSWHFLPNLVDEGVFSERVRLARSRRSEIRGSLNVCSSARLFIWVARLEERTKGVLRFLKAIQDLLDLTDLTIVIAGDGNERPAVEEWIRRRKSKNVRLLGHQTEQSVVDLLAAADVFLLPSVRDPNPLAAIEALWAGLPLLISERIGNLPEVLVNGFNGWSFDPFQQEQARLAFQKAQLADNTELKAMGLRSHKIAQDGFSTGTVIARFVESLMNRESS